MDIKLNKRKLSNGWTVKESYRKYKDIMEEAKKRELGKQRYVFLGMARPISCS